MLKRSAKTINFGDQVIGDGKPVFIIAEIGINHNGSLKQAFQLIDAVKDAGADCAKFQMRHLPSLYVNAGDPDDPSENLGSQYTLDLLSRFELSPKDMFKAFDYCKKVGIMPLCTPWDITSLKQLETYSMEGYKVSSADMTNHALLSALAKTGKPLIVSTGMSDEKEVKETVALLKQLDVQYALLHCNSTYPTPFKDVNLSYMHRLQKIGDCIVGYSGHERGLHIPIAAAALGAKIIEKHITLDKNMEGNDHKISLLPDEFKTMVEMIRQVEDALGSNTPRQITQGERMNRANLAKSLVATRDLKTGERITADMVAVKSPGRGLQPNNIDKLIGRFTKRNLKSGDFFYPADLKKKNIRSKTYRFRRPWGIPVRYYDFKQLTMHINPDFVEFHLSYKDLDQDISRFFDQKYDLGFVVHSPDLFAGDHLLNLASEDEKYRRRSIKELQRVVNTTRDLKKYFKRVDRPLVIVSLGGFSENGFCDPGEREKMYARVADSLAKIDQKGVEIVAQTLPPYPWYFGGQLYANLFVDPHDTTDFCTRFNIRLCLDTSHSKLACNNFNWSFKEFINRVGSHIAHLHIVDAKGVDQEGLQIGEGDIDFPSLSVQLDKVAPNIPFIPEIWQGHENKGEGFWIALKRLEKFFGSKRN